MKPRSMIWFDWLFWASIILGIVSIAYLWPTMTAELEAEPGLGRISVGAIIATVALGNGLSILLWFFVSEKASNTARWIYCVLAGLGAIAGLIDWQHVPAIEVAMNLALSILSIASIVLLFLPASNAWFRNGRVGGPDDIKAFE